MYWIIRLNYSVTDQDTIIVKARTRELALDYPTNARYKTIIAGPIASIYNAI